MNGLAISRARAHRVLTVKCAPIVCRESASIYNMYMRIELLYSWWRNLLLAAPRLGGLANAAHRVSRFAQWNRNDSASSSPSSLVCIDVARDIVVAADKCQVTIECTSHIKLTVYRVYWVSARSAIIKFRWNTFGIINVQPFVYMRWGSLCWTDRLSINGLLLS